MNFIMEYWPVLVSAFAAVLLAVIVVIRFCKSNRKEQIKKIREWLLYATTLAEKELGGGTGKLKLRFVYDMFAVKFPWMVQVISFDRFSGLVDEVLHDMNALLQTNSAVQLYVNGPVEVNENAEG